MNDEKTTYYSVNEDPGNAQLYIYDRSGRITVHHLKDGETLGRDFEGATSSIRLDSPIVSRKHGEFLVTPTNHLKGRGCPKCGNSDGK